MNEFLHHPASTTPPEFTEPDMLRIPEGWFLMGADANQPGQDNERPVHRVWIDAFELAACQVTNADYAKFLAATKHDKVHASRSTGTIQISRTRSSRSLRHRGSTHGILRMAKRDHEKRYRLPTEAEWERAARGGPEQKLYPWGDAPLETLENYASRWKTGPSA